VTGIALAVPSWKAARGGSAFQSKKAPHEEEGVAPPEDLMREHGVLKRVLLIYEEGIRRIDAKQQLPPEPIKNSAQIIRSFIEDDHEKLEEDYLFPRFEKAKKLVDLTTVLRAQHQAGTHTDGPDYGVGDCRLLKGCVVRRVSSSACNARGNLLREF
jgi:hypothetical protein